MNKVITFIFIFIINMHLCKAIGCNYNCNRSHLPHHYTFLEKIIYNAPSGINIIYSTILLLFLPIYPILTIIYANLFNKWVCPIRPLIYPLSSIASTCCFCSIKDLSIFYKLKTRLKKYSIKDYTSAQDHQEFLTQYNTQKQKIKKKRFLAMLQEIELQTFVTKILTTYHNFEYDDLNNEAKCTLFEQELIKMQSFSNASEILAYFRTVRDVKQKIDKIKRRLENTEEEYNAKFFNQQQWSEELTKWLDFSIQLLFIASNETNCIKYKERFLYSDILEEKLCLVNLINFLFCIFIKKKKDNSKKTTKSLQYRQLEFPFKKI